MGRHRQPFNFRGAVVVLALIIGAWLVYEYVLRGLLY